MQYCLLLLGVFACSTSVVFIKKSDIDPVLLSGLRLAVATVVLTPLFLRDWRRHRSDYGWRHLRASAVPGAVLAVHFISWIIGARLTPAANSSLIVNILPVVMPFFLYFLVRETVTKWELMATLVGAIGLCLLFIADFQIQPEHFTGDLVCFGSMLLFAWYIALARKFRHLPTVWLYLVPLYAAAAVVSFAASPFLAQRKPIDWSAEWVWVLALGLVPTVIGHSLLNNAMRRLRGQVVSLLNMTQFVFAGLLAYPFLGETPNWTFYPASLAVVAAGAMAVARR